MSMACACTPGSKAGAARGVAGPVSRADGIAGRAVPLGCKVGWTFIGDGRVLIVS
jgi:hypothetical protein